VAASLLQFWLYGCMSAQLLVALWLQGDFPVGTAAVLTHLATRSPL
jgi:hypothetical protein